jgi:hypothetical protein
MLINTFIEVINRNKWYNLQGSKIEALSKYSNNSKILYHMECFAGIITKTKIK